MTVEADIARQMLDGTISEFDWQNTVLDEAHRLGWKLHFEPHWYWRAIREFLTNHPNYWRYLEKSERGWPDVVGWHVGHRRTIYAELKTETGTLQPDQKARLIGLWEAGNEVYVWRPRDRDQVDRILNGEPREDTQLVFSKRTIITREHPS